MRAVDTNVLLRLLVRDDARQLKAAEDFVAKGAWVSHLVLVETLWVLDSVYARSAQQIGTAVETLLAHAELNLQDADVVAAALAIFPPTPGSVSRTACFSRPRGGQGICRLAASTGSSPCSKARSDSDCGRVTAGGSPTAGGPPISPRPSRHRSDQLC